jgi:hypothetical protein
MPDIRFWNNEWWIFLAGRPYRKARPEEVKQ